MGHHQAERLRPAAHPHPSFSKDGRMSVGGARQWPGMLGKQPNHGAAVSLHAASVPISRQLPVPTEWDDDAGRRRRTRLSDEDPVQDARAPHRKRSGHVVPPAVGNPGES
ncbi:transposase [Embleya sp. NPDC055664]